jgi:hypothetical protein
MHQGSVMADKRIAGLVISEEDYELLRCYAYDNRINGISEVVRHLIRISPQLQEYAEIKGMQVEFNARQWGGGRK